MSRLTKFIPAKLRAISRSLGTAVLTRTGFDVQQGKLRVKIKWIRRLLESLDIPKNGISDFDLIAEALDTTYYSLRYPEVAVALAQGLDPVEHYMEQGWKEGRDPAHGFSTRWYLEAYPEVAATGANPFAHYLKFGREEGRVPAPLTVLFLDGSPGSLESFLHVHRVQDSLARLGVEVRTASRTEELSNDWLFEADLFVLINAADKELGRQVIAFATAHGRPVVQGYDQALPSGTLLSMRAGADREARATRRGSTHPSDHSSDLPRLDTSDVPPMTAATGETKFVHSYRMRDYPPQHFMEVGFSSEKGPPAPLAHRILFLGNGSSDENDFRVCAEALGKIMVEYPEVSLHIFGTLSIENFPGLVHLLGKRVFVKPLLQPLDHYKLLSEALESADVVVDPGRPSRASVKNALRFVEAGAFGVPCASSDSEGPGRDIINGETGFLCSDGPGWFNALEELITNPAAYQRISTNAKDYVLSHYRERNLDAEVGDVYTHLVKQYPTLRQRWEKPIRDGFMPSIRINAPHERKVGWPTRRLPDDDEDLPSIDVSVVTHFSSRWLEDFFRSLSGQDYPTQKVHLYLTDHSEDADEMERVRQLAGRYGHEFASFELAEQQNLGFGAGHNRNADRGVSEYILVTNCDLVLPRDSLKILAQEALRSTADTASWEARQQPFEHPKFYDPVTLRVAWSSAACVLFRRGAYEEVGGFDDHIFMYGEDVDLSFRLRDAGYHLRYVPKAIAWHYTYEDEDSFKPLQAVGSLLGHCYIRLRFGSPEDIAQVPALYRGHLKRLRNRLRGHGALVRQHRKLFRQNRHYFAEEGRRRQSTLTFPFFSTGYEAHREGAFYRTKTLPAKGRPTVSVVVRVHGENTLLLNEAVTSLLNQTYSDIEIVVAEDQGTHSLSYCKALSERGHRVRHLNSVAGGRSASGNLGLGATSGDLLMFLDYDDVVMADHVEALVAELSSDSGAGAAVALSWAVYTEYLPNSYREAAYTRGQPNLDAVSFESLRKNNLMPIQAVLFRRTLYAEFGGLDEELRGFEDWELWVRYSRYSRFVVVPKMTSLYRLRNEFSFHALEKTKRERYARGEIEQKYGGSGEDLSSVRSSRTTVY